jgi:Flp pilus assembly protein TadG
VCAGQVQRFWQRLSLVRRQSGQATVEFVFAAGLLLFLLLASLDFGRAFFGYLTIINASREGARAAVFTANPASIEPAVRQEAQGNHLDPALLSVQSTSLVSGQPVVVTVSYHFNLIVTSFLPFDHIHLQASTTMLLP